LWPAAGVASGVNAAETPVGSEAGFVIDRLTLSPAPEATLFVIVVAPVLVPDAGMATVTVVGAADRLKASCAGGVQLTVVPFRSAAAGVIGEPFVSVNWEAGTTPAAGISWTADSPARRPGMTPFAGQATTLNVTLMNWVSTLVGIVPKANRPEL